MKPIITFLIALTICLLEVQGQSNDRQIQESGKIKQIRTIPHGVAIRTEHAWIEVLCYLPDVIRIRCDRKALKPDHSYAVVREPLSSFDEVIQGKDSILLKTKEVQVIIQTSPLRFSFRDNYGHLLSQEYDDFGITWLGDEGSCHRKLFPDERFIGLGEKTGPLNRRGYSYENWNTDHHYRPDSDPLYKSIPFFMGIHDSLTYGIFLDNSYRTLFDFGASTDDLFSRFSVGQGELNYYFFGGSSIREIIRDYTWLTGRMPLPPYWSLGYQQCRWGYYPDTEVLRIASTFREKRLPCDVIYLDIDYMDQYKIFTWDSIRFPDPAGMITRLRRQGFHLAAIVDPGIKVEPGYAAYDEGVKNHGFVTYPGGKPYVGSVWPGRCHFPDFTNPQVRSWWGKSFASLTLPGVEGFWNDMNEPAVWGQRIPDILECDYEGYGATMARVHNVYGLCMTMATYEGTKKLLHGKRPFLLSRAAFAGSQRYTAVWTGDNTASDDHLFTAIRLINSIGLSGIAFCGADIGGFFGTPSPALFSRWMAVGCYTPFYRNHTIVNSKDQEPWAFGEETEQYCREILNERYRLLPYIYSLFYEATQSGLPVTRSMAIDYPFEEKVFTWDYQNQFLLGEAFLIAPVSSDQRYLKVWFPPGGWYNYATGQEIKGEREQIVETPWNYLPVFVRAGSIIPFQSVIQSTDEQPDSVLEWHVYNGEEYAAFTYYEDDGETFACDTGVYHKRTVVFDPRQRKLVFTAVSGTYPSRYTSYVIRFHGFNKEIPDLIVPNSNENFELNL